MLCSPYLKQEWLQQLAMQMVIDPSDEPLCHLNSLFLRAVQIAWWPNYWFPNLKSHVDIDQLEYFNLLCFREFQSNFHHISATDKRRFNCLTLRFISLWKSYFWVTTVSSQFYSLQSTNAPRWLSKIGILLFWQTNSFLAALTITCFAYKTHYCHELFA